jgi:hypothetical protein
MKKKMTQQEIDNLINVKTEQEIFTLYPKAKKLYSKITHCYYKIKPAVWAKFYYNMKNEQPAWDFYKGTTSDIDYDKINLERIYTGIEKIGEYKDIWANQTPKNEGIYVPSK